MRTLPKYPILLLLITFFALLGCGAGQENAPTPSPSPSPSSAPLPPDFDQDGVADSADNCFDVVNPSQGDKNGNGIGDACDLPEAEYYEAAVPGSLKILQLDQVSFPTRLKLSPDGQLMFVAELGGTVHVYERINDNWVRQADPFLEQDLGGLDISEERGMTGLFLGANFDPNNTDPFRRDLFVTYQFYDGADYLNRITRVTVSRIGGAWSATNPLLIYEGPDPINSASPIGAHQIQDGFSLIYEGLPHLLVAVGDGFFSASATDESFESLGKILLMQRDGSPAAGTRPFSNAFQQAKGIRNVYSMALLPESLDPRQRVFGVENGAGFQDRLWFLELIDFGHETDEGINLGWNGNDSAPSWTSISDLNSPGFLNTEGVLRLISPPLAPTGLTLHPGRGVVSAPPNQAAFATAHFGSTYCTTSCAGKEIVAGTLGNFGNQPTIDQLTPIVVRSAAGQGLLSGPTALDLDPMSGDLIFSDLFTGDIHRIVVFPSSSP